MSGLKTALREEAKSAKERCWFVKDYVSSGAEGTRGEKGRAVFAVFAVSLFQVS